MLRNLLEARRTTVAGVLGLIVLFCSTLRAQIDGDPSTVPDWGRLITEVIYGIGLIWAKDSNVTGGTILNPKAIPDPQPPGG